MVVDHPARLAEPLGVGLVGDDLGLRHVQPHDPHQARPSCWCRCGPRRRRTAPCAGTSRGSIRLARGGTAVGRSRCASTIGRYRVRHGLRGGAIGPLLSVVVPVVRRRGLPARLPGLDARPVAPDQLEVVVVDDGSPRRVGRHRRGVRRPRPAGPGRAHRQPRTRRGPQRGAAARHRRPARRSPTPTTWSRPAAYAALLAPAGADRVGLGHRLGRPLGGRPASSSRRGCGGCTSPARRTSSSTTTRRSSATCSRGTSCSGARFWRGDRASPGPRASATRTSRRRRWLPRGPGGSTCSPRSSTTGGSGTTAPRSPSSARRCATSSDRLGDQAESLASVEEYVAGGDPKVTCEVFLDRVLAGDLHRYFAEIPGCDDEWWELLRTGVAAICGSTAR